MAAQERPATRPRHPAEMGLLARTIHGALQFVAWLVLALLFSILLEWVGMLFVWREEDAAHSRTMLLRELSYLNQNFRQSVLVSRPAQFAAQSGEALYHYLFEGTHVVDMLQWLKAPPHAQDAWPRLLLRALLLPASEYLTAAMTITQVFGVRLAVLALATPVFVLFGLVGLTDGLVRRDLRKWSGGWESSFVYHHAKRFLVPLPVVSWIVYLCLPISVHPNVVILPFAILFGLAVGITAGMFKKHL
jgi:integrating conjugative element membrane protein (TIGR03747 family)